MNTDHSKHYNIQHIHRQHTHRIPNIVPIRKVPTSIPKIQSNMPIRCKLRTKEEYNNKFETDEEVYTEQECGRVSISGGQDGLSRKNSFVNHPNSNKNTNKNNDFKFHYNGIQYQHLHNKQGEERVQNKQNRFYKFPSSSSFSSTSNQNNTYYNPDILNIQTDQQNIDHLQLKQTNEGFEDNNMRGAVRKDNDQEQNCIQQIYDSVQLQRKQLSVYHCDSLCIRPNPPPQKHPRIQKQVTSSSEKPMSNDVYKTIIPNNNDHTTTNTTIIMLPSPDYSYSSVIHSNQRGSISSILPHEWIKNNQFKSQEYIKRNTQEQNLDIKKEKAVQQMWKDNFSKDKSMKIEEKQEKCENQGVPQRILLQIEQKNVNKIRKSKKLGIFQSKKPNNNDQSVLTSLIQPIKTKYSKQQYVQDIRNIIQEQAYRPGNGNQWKREDMHIVFQTDQITQCCL